MTIRYCQSLAVLMGILLGPSLASGQQRYSGIIDQILTAWKTADIVCLGEDHGRVYDSDLRIALVRHPAFPQTVSTIIIESANPIHQDLLDHFILDGAAMTRQELAPIWRDASSSETWESPIYEQFLRAVREVNLTLPRQKRIRIIGGDSKIDWAQIKTAEELAPLVNRGGNIRTNIAEQILDKHLKALAIYGGGHCVRIGRGFPGELTDQTANNRKYAADRFWSIGEFPRGTAVERAHKIFGLGSNPAYIVLRGTKWESEESTARMAKLYDAIMYHGDVPDKVSNADLSDLPASYRPELERRRRLLDDATKLWLQQEQRPHPR